MNKIKAIWSSLTGSFSSIIPLFFACCKSGACVGVCASPVASLFGISSASIASSPLINALEPVLIAISAVSFTISYYSIYVIPKFSCATDCACEPGESKGMSERMSKIIFWVGLIASIFFFTYFEIQKHKAADVKAPMSACSHEDMSTDSKSTCCVADSTEVEEKACCSGEKKCD